METRSWEDFNNYTDANKNKFVLPPEDAGYVLRIDHMTAPEVSPFENRDKQGNLLPPSWQTSATFTIVDYPNDDPDTQEGQSVIGQVLRQFYTISLNTKANFYKLARAAFGGDLDPTWKPNPADLYGRLVSAQLIHREPNDKGQVFPKIDAVVAYRGKKRDFASFPVAGPYVKADIVGAATIDDVPF